MMKFWAITVIMVITAISAPATASDRVDSIISQKRAKAESLKAQSENKIDYLRNNKESSNIITTSPSYDLDKLETASGTKFGKTVEDKGIKAADGNIAKAVEVETKSKVKNPD